MKKTLFSSFKKATALILLISVIFTGCASNKTTANKTTDNNASSNKGADGKLSVLTSFNAIDKLVKEVGKDNVESRPIVKPGVEAHDFELTPRDLEDLNKSNLLFINGLGMEHWAEADKLTANNKSLKIVDLSTNIDAIKDPETDPHIWLGSKELRVMATNVYKALSEADKANDNYYKENLNNFIEELDALDKEYLPKFENHKGKAFVTGHEAFAYLCRNLSLKQMAVEGVFEEGEPTPQKIKELIDFVKSQKITTVFLEENASPKVSETISRETNTKLVAIPTLESEGEIIPSLKEIYDKVLESFK